MAALNAENVAQKRNRHALLDSAVTPLVMIGAPTTNFHCHSNLEQLARSLSMDGALGRHDAQVVAEVLRWLARHRTM